MSVCHLCFNVACDCGLTYFHLKLMSASLGVCLLLEFIFYKRFVVLFSKL